jgi:hypothetical protein
MLKDVNMESNLFNNRRPQYFLPRDGLAKGECERCGKKSNCMSCSFLNTQWICLECQQKEKDHPLYEEAKKAELEETTKGNYNYPGLLDGKPLGEW